MEQKLRQYAKCLSVLKKGGKIKAERILSKVIVKLKG